MPPFPRPSGVVVDAAPASGMVCSFFSADLAAGCRAAPLPPLAAERNLPCNGVVSSGVLWSGCLRLVFAPSLLPLFSPLIPMLRLLECLWCVRVGV